MSLSLLDLCLIAQFGFHADFPAWLWVLAILDGFGYWTRIERITKALERPKP